MSDHGLCRHCQGTKYILTQVDELGTMENKPCSVCHAKGLTPNTRQIEESNSFKARVALENAVLALWRFNGDSSKKKDSP